MIWLKVDLDFDSTPVVVFDLDEFPVLCCGWRFSDVENYIIF